MSCTSWVDMAWENDFSRACAGHGAQGEPATGDGTPIETPRTRVSLPLAGAKNGSAPEDSPSEDPTGALSSHKEKLRMLNRIADECPGSWVLLSWKQPMRMDDAER